MSTFFNKIQDAMMNKKEERQTDAFKENLQKMIAKDEFSLLDFIEELDTSLNSWKLKVTNLVSNNAEIATLKKTRALLEAMQIEMPPTGYVELDRKQKLVVAARSGQTVEDINKLNDQFSKMRVMQQWMRRRHLDKVKLPENQLDAQRMLSADIALNNNKYIDKKWLKDARKASGKQMGRR